MSVTAAQWFSRVALLDDGTTVPITNLLDEFGDETDDPDEAVTFVAGEATAPAAIKAAILLHVKALYDQLAGPDFEAFERAQASLIRPYRRVGV